MSVVKFEVIHTHSLALQGESSVNGEEVIVSFFKENFIPGPG